MTRRRPKQPQPQPPPEPDRPRRPLKKAARTSHLVRATQAAAELGLPYTTVRQLAFQGEFPVMKIGRAWYFRRMDLEAYISRQLRLLAS
jgi:excisionase family DNA binding protein